MDTIELLPNGLRSESDRTYALAGLCLVIWVSVGFYVSGKKKTSRSVAGLQPVTKSAASTKSAAKPLCYTDMSSAWPFETIEDSFQTFTPTPTTTILDASTPLRTPGPTTTAPHCYCYSDHEHSAKQFGPSPVHVLNAPSGPHRASSTVFITNVLSVIVIFWSLAIAARFLGLHKLGDNGAHIKAFEAGMDKTSATLRKMEDEKAGELTPPKISNEEWRANMRKNIEEIQLDTARIMARNEAAEREFEIESAKLKAQAEAEEARHKQQLAASFAALPGLPGEAPLAMQSPGNHASDSAEPNTDSETASAAPDPATDSKGDDVFQKASKSALRRLRAKRSREKQRELVTAAVTAREDAVEEVVKKMAVKTAAAEDVAAEETAAAEEGQ